MKNVVLLFADDMRYGMIDNPYVITPNLDRLAEKGVMFRNAHIPGGTSGAVCMPSRAMLHTGRLLEDLASFGKYIPLEHIMLGEVLQKHNYITYGIGKWHNGTDSYNRGFSDGSEIFFGGMEDHWNVPANNYDPTGKYEKKIKKSRNPYNSNEIAVHNCDHVTPGKHSSELFADASIEFIENRDKTNPFFLYTSFMAPHDPRTMPQEFLDMYDISNTKLPENYMPLHPFDFSGIDTRDERLAPHPRTEDIVKQHLTEYYAMITHLDHCIGRILESLESESLLEDTLIIFAADNGLAVGSHGLMGKQNLYEHSIRVPLILSGPEIPEKTTSDAAVYIADLYPTILDYLGIPKPSSCQVNSILPVINDQETARNVLYLRYKNSIAGIKKDGYKLIKYMKSDQIRMSLFNLEEDPGETNDLINSPEHSNLISELLDEIETNWKVLEL